MKRLRCSGVCAYVVALAAFLTTLHLVLGCSSPAMQGATIAAYAGELDGCIAQGKQAHSLDVYEACAQGVDKKFGRVKDGGK